MTDNKNDGGASRQALSTARFPKLAGVGLAPLSVALAGIGALAPVAATAGQASTPYDDFYDVTTGQVLVQNVLGNDPVFNNLVVCAFTQPQHGVANVAANGQLVYHANAGYSGPDTLTYSDCVPVKPTFNVVAVANVFITVLPDAVDDGYTTPYAKPVTGNVLGNDVGNGLHVVSFSSPASGALPGGVGADGSFTYVPNAGFTGADSFTYAIQDSYGSNAVAQVNLTVTPVTFDFLYSGQAFDNQTPNPPPGNGTAQSTPIHNSFPQLLTVIVQQNGAAVSGVDVCFAVVPAGNGASASLSATRVTTNANGVASVLAVANGVVGSYTANATICSTAVEVDRRMLKAAGNAALVFQLSNQPIAAIPTLGGGMLALLSMLLGWLGISRRRR